MAEDVFKLLKRKHGSLPRQPFKMPATPTRFMNFLGPDRLNALFSVKTKLDETGKLSAVGLNELLKSLGLELGGFLREQRMYAEYAAKTQTEHSTAMEKYREAKAIQDVAKSIRTRPGQALFELRRGGVERAPSPMPQGTRPPPKSKRRKGMRDEDLQGSGVPRPFGDVFRNLRR